MKYCSGVLLSHGGMLLIHLIMQYIIDYSLSHSLTTLAPDCKENDPKCNKKINIFDQLKSS